jgi:hypothetical protein
VCKNIGYLIVLATISIGLDKEKHMNYHWIMKLNLLNKNGSLKKEKEELKKFWKDQFAELTKKQLGLPVKLYHL